MTEKVKQQHMFSNKMIAGILIPVVLEQLLNSIMGTADTMMVSNIGSAAISAVSLVDSINILVIQAFSALAAGGAIVCSQYIGQQNKKMANESARQVLFIITAISIAVSVLCLGFKKPLLRLIFGSVEADVMRASETYFFYTAISFPFIAAYDSAASIFRAQENTKGPMLISMISNAMNIVGNAIMIWIFHMVTWITLVKPIVWTLAFVPAYGLRAAGDVKFSMITSCLVMWLCRFCLCVILIRFLGFGPMGVWIGMFADWTVRAVIFTWRFHSRRWLRYKVI